MIGACLIPNNEKKNVILQKKHIRKCPCCKINKNSIYKYQNTMYNQET
jgi:hypothetical protein